MSRLVPMSLLCAAISGCGANPSPPAPGRNDAPAPAGCWNPATTIPLRGKTCGPVTPPQISCYLPSDVDGKLSQPDLSVRQRAADIFSWQEFIALNWPALAGQRGQPDRAAKIGAPGPRVWETWKEEYEVFLPGGDKPPPWNDAQPIPPACKSHGAKLLTRTQKIDDVFDATAQAAATDGVLPATLKDRKGRVVYYEIRMNEVMFQHIVDKQLYDGKKQTQATSVSFPDGAMLIKAAWRELGPAESGLFEAAASCICKKDPKSGRPSDCHDGPRMGLVGLHITQKTPSAPQWIWSTFEEIHNVASLGGVPPSFYNPDCKDCQVNQQTPPGIPNQVVRAIPIPDKDPVCTAPEDATDNIRQLDREMAEALAAAGTVLSRYELVGTQWPSSKPDPANPTVFSVLPALLANTTMETFVQGTSTCMGCHSTARTVNPNTFVSSDFTFVLNNASPKPPDTQVIPWTNQPGTSWDKEHWDAIRRGHDLTEHTYEELPAFVGSKLHCESCHLDAGTNFKAACWVNMGPMPKEMHSPLTPQFSTTESLQARINSCFEHSLNGKPLCTPKSGTSPGTCIDRKQPGAQAMNALITYMQWVTEQWIATHPGNTDPPNGYPPIDGKSGSKDSGRRIFAERCAVCHGADGQGRYGSGKYYRPALWGPDSFNSCAGMATPATAAAFVHGNMPFQAGGLLTSQEAWDVATFVDCQSRPAGMNSSRQPCASSCPSGQ